MKIAMQIILLAGLFSVSAFAQDIAQEKDNVFTAVIGGYNKVIGTDHAESVKAIEPNLDPAEMPGTSYLVTLANDAYCNAKMTDLGKGKVEVQLSDCRKDTVINGSERAFEVRLNYSIITKYRNGDIGLN